MAPTNLCFPSDLWLRLMPPLHIGNSSNHPCSARSWCYSGIINEIFFLTFPFTSPFASILRVFFKMNMILISNKLESIVICYNCRILFYFISLYIWQIGWNSREGWQFRFQVINERSGYFFELCFIYFFKSIRTESF